MKKRRTKQSDLGYNQTIRDSIQKIALHGLVSPSTGAVVDTGKVNGFVAKIHTEGDLAGTIDVQEFSSFPMSTESDVKVGYHEGVYLSALQDNKKGYLIVPKLYSEVVIMTDTETKRKYVSMFSHVDVIQLDSHEAISIGVTEREEYDVDDENAPDIEDLEETGVFSKTTYEKNTIKSEVQGKSSSDKSTQVISDKQVKTVVGDDKSSLLINQDRVHIKHDKAEQVVDGSSVTSQMGQSKVKVTDGTVYVGSDSGTDDAVLGVELASILSELVGYIGQIITTTQLGPQPPMNVANFVSLKAKIESFKASHSGFLTRKVQIQK